MQTSNDNWFTPDELFTRDIFNTLRENLFKNAAQKHQINFQPEPTPNHAGYQLPTPNHADQSFQPDHPLNHPTQSLKLFKNMPLEFIEAILFLILLPKGERHDR